MRTSDIINATEAAEILGISVRAVQHRIMRGTLPAQKLPGRTGAYVLNRNDVEKAKADDLEAAS